MARFILLDRDGVINRRVRNGYVACWRDFVFLPGAPEALRLLHEAGYASIVVSNQAGVGKGLITLSCLNQITDRFLRRVKSLGGLIHSVYYCTHPKGVRCQCRKPRPGLLLKAREQNKFDFADTYMVGDSLSDLRAAQCVGCPMVLVSGNPSSLAIDGTAHPETMVPDLLSAVIYILRRGIQADAGALIADKEYNQALCRELLRSSSH